MIWFTDVRKNKVAINPRHVVAVFTALEAEFMGKTVISLINGQLIVEEQDIEVVGMLSAFRNGDK